MSVSMLWEVAGGWRVWARACGILGKGGVSWRGLSFFFFDMGSRCGKSGETGNHPPQKEKTYQIPLRLRPRRPVPLRSSPKLSQPISPPFPSLLLLFPPAPISPSPPLPFFPHAIKKRKKKKNAPRKNKQGIRVLAERVQTGLDVGDEGGGFVFLKRFDYPVFLRARRGGGRLLEGI